jgi:predicted Zn-dependent protease
LRAIDKIPFGYSESQGFVRNFTFYHRDLGLAFRFPDDWRITNQSDRVSALNRENDVLIEMRLAGRAQGAPADVLRKAVGGAREVMSTTINGLAAATTTTTVRGYPTRAAVFFLGKNAYLVGGQARTDAAMQPALPLINATIASFHALSDTERNSVRPLTLRIINAPAGATFAELARNSPLGKNAVAHLRLLNGLYPKGEPTAGQPLKIIE